MKRIILICLLLASGSLHSQQISQEMKQTWINMLDSTDLEMEVIESIKENKVVEALPKLESTIWNRDEVEQGIFIAAIGYLKSPNTSNIAHRLLDTLTNYPQKYYTEYDSTISFVSSFKERITESLLYVNDYSTVNIIWESVDKGNANISILIMLDTLVSRASVPLEISNHAKSSLLSIVNNKQKFEIGDRIIALSILAAKYGSEMYDLIKDYHYHESVYWARLCALDYLKKSNYPAFESFIKESTITETNAMMRRRYYDIIFDDYYSPANIKWLKERLKLDADPSNKISLEAILDYYVLIRSDIMTSPIDIIDTLKNHTEKCSQLFWLKDSAYKNELINYLTTGKNYLIGKDSLNCAISIKLFQNYICSINADSVNNYPKYVSPDAKNILNYYSQQILNKLSKLPTVKFNNSQGKLIKTGFLQYYEGAWKDAVNNNDGTFTVPTTLKTVSLRMNYAYSSQTKSNVSIGVDTVVFQTANVQVKLQNSSGVVIDTGKVQYYAGAWREFGATANGIAGKELLPGSYSFRITYAYASLDKAQDVSTNNVVVFQTVPATVQLKNSAGAFIDQGTVQYYAGAWREFGAISNGSVVKELLPLTYSFRMSYGYASLDKSQNVGTDATVIFQTVPATVQLKNSAGAFIDQGTVQYYAGAWREFGTISNGSVVKELLPLTYSFRMSYGYASLDKSQNVGTDATVIFQTVPATVQLKNSAGAFIDQGIVQYYSGAWRDFGTTSNGSVVKELLPLTYSFRMSYGYASLDKSQNVGTDATVIFQTVPATVQLKNSAGAFIDQGTVQYYAGAWREFGTTSNGSVVKELLPLTYSFRMSYGYASLDKSQNVGTDATVIFQTVPATVQLKNSSGSFLDQGTVQYYAGAWREFGTTSNGSVVKELLPLTYSFRMSYGYASLDKSQNVGTDATVIFQTVPATVQLKNSAGAFIDQGTVQYYAGAWREFGKTANGVASKELLPLSYSFRMTHEYVTLDKTQNVGTSNIVLFNTVLATINVLDAQNQPVSGATVSYYSGAWRQIGTTVNGVITKELLPVSLTFRGALGTKQADKTQNVGTNNNVEIKLP
jgi:hypothetical protein